MLDAPEQSFNDRARAPKSAPLITVFITLAYVSFIAHLFNSYAIRQFLAEFTRLTEKFL